MSPGSVPVGGRQRPAHRDLTRRFMVDTIWTEAQLGGLYGSQDANEPETAAIRGHASQPSREAKSPRSPSASRFSVQCVARCNPDFRADHQGDLGEAPESHGVAGKSLAGITASLGLMRFAAIREHFDMAALQGS